MQQIQQIVAVDASLQVHINQINICGCHSRLAPEKLFTGKPHGLSQVCKSIQLDWPSYAGLMMSLSELFVLELFTDKAGAAACTFAEHMLPQSWGKQLNDFCV